MGRGMGIVSYLRGKVFVIDQPAYYAGINLAYAGKMRSLVHSYSTSKDHPRPCGEKKRRAKSGVAYTGSPPPMRGKALSYTMIDAPPRITPAHAGKSPSAGSFFAHGKDHPRPCGEKAIVSPPIHTYIGSPPPMRGKDTVAHVNTFRIRITPAHAGKRQAQHIRHLRDRDHPRPCGEKLDGVAPQRDIRGSPPPMRGKDFRLDFVLNMCRITPAHAGKRPRAGFRAPRRWDHPRPCGEKLYAGTG